MILVRSYIGLRNISSSGVHIISKTFHRYKFIEFTSVLLLNGNRTSSSSSSIPRERLERTTVRNIFKPLPFSPATIVLSSTCQTKICHWQSVCVSRSTRARLPFLINMRKLCYLFEHVKLCMRNMSAFRVGVCDHSMRLLAMVWLWPRVRGDVWGEGEEVVVVKVKVGKTGEGRRDKGVLP